MPPWGFRMDFGSCGQSPSLASRGRPFVHLVPGQPHAPADAYEHGPYAPGEFRNGPLI